MSLFDDINGNAHNGFGHNPLHDLHEALARQEEVDRQHREMMEQAERDRQFFEQQQRELEEQQRQMDEANRRNLEEQLERDRLDTQRRATSDHSEAVTDHTFTEVSERTAGAEAAAASAATSSTRAGAEPRVQPTQARAGSQASGITNGTERTATSQTSRTASKIPNLHESLAEVRTYELPIIQKLEGGVELMESPVAAFEHAGNWYVAPKVNGKIPTDPKSWSLVVDEFEYHPNTRFYHEPADVRMQEAHVDMVHEIGSGLTAKQKAGTLVESGAGLKPQDMAKIILDKEKEGAGLRLGTEEPLHQFLAEHGLKPFKPTLEEVAAANRVTFAGDSNAYFAGLAEQRLGVHHASGKAFKAKPMGGSLGGAFSDPRENVFYATHPDNPGQFRRLKVGFDEMMMPDGTRVHQPSIKETNISFADAMAEIGPKANIAHAPEDISSFMQTGNTASLERYAKTHMASDYAGRQMAHEHFTQLEGALHQTTTHHMMGEELAGKNLTTQAWHRVVRPEDYVPQVTGSSTSAGSSALEAAADRVFDGKRADYFLLREHPDYSAALQSSNFSDYHGPREQLVFLKGDPAGIKPAAIEFVDLEGSRGIDTLLELRKRGIGSDTKLLKIGRDEYAELWNQRSLNQHIDDFQLRRQTAKDTIQHKPLEFYKLGTDHPLAEPIRVNAAGKLVGDVGGLSQNGLYKLGEDHFIHITPKMNFGKEAPQKFSYTVYKKGTSGAMEHAGRESCLYDGEFEHKLADLIKQKGTLVQATETEVLGVAEHLRQAAKGAGDQALYAGHNLSELLHHDKPKLPEGIAGRLEQAAEGTLSSTYTNVFAKKSQAPREKPAASATGSSAGTAEKTVAQEAGSSAARVEQSTSRSVSSGASSVENAAGKAEGAFTKFMKNEKWIGKKGAAFAAVAAAAIGAVYVANKVWSKKPEEQENKPWTERTKSRSNGAQLSASL